MKILNLKGIHMQNFILLIIVFFLIGCGGGSSTEKDTKPLTSSIKDTKPPTILIKGANPFRVEFGSTYKDLGAIAKDDTDGNIKIKTIGNVDTTKLGTYTITYTATDNSGNKSNKKRTVKVVDTIKPIISLKGEKTINIKQGVAFQDLGATATDNIDGKIEVKVTGNVDTSEVGDYILTYTAIDNSGNKTTETRKVNVISRIIGSIKTLADARDIKLSKDGTLAFLATYNNGLQIVDITNPKEPKVISSVPTPSNALEITLSPDETKVYVSDDNDIQLIDTSNPSNPIAMGGVSAQGNVYGVAFPSNHPRAYVTTNLDGLKVIDISDINNQIILSSGLKYTDTFLKKLVFSEDSSRVYMMDNYHGIDIVDINTSVNPLLLGSITTQNPVNGVALSNNGNTIHIIEDNKLQIFNISNVSNPILLGSMPITESADGSANYITISKDNTKAYITRSYYGLQIIDISNPNNLTTIQKIKTPGSAMRVAISDNGKYAYIAAGGLGLQIIDISDF